MLVALGVLCAWIASRVRARRATLITRFGPIDRLSDDSEVGKTVVLEGTLREGAQVERFSRPKRDDEVRGDEVLAASVRLPTDSAGNDGELVARRGRDLGLVVDGRHLRITSEVEVLSGSDPVALGGKALEALASEDRKTTALFEHVVVRGMHVTVRARLEREESGYRGGGFVLVAPGDAPPRLAATRPSVRSLARGGAVIGLLTLALALGLGQVVAISLGARVRAELTDAAPRDAPADELPLTWSHRVALLGHRPDDALRAFDRLLARGHTNPALLAMTADAHARRGDCAGAISVFASHGAFELGRAYTAQCNLGPAVLVARAELERMDGEIETALSWIDRNADDALAVPRPREDRAAAVAFRAQLLIEAGRYDEAARELEVRVRPTLSRRSSEPPARGVACLTAALTITHGAGGRMPRDETHACALLRDELEDVAPSVWWDDDVGELRWVGAAAAYATHEGLWTLALGAPSSWTSLGAVVHGEWPRWNGLVRAALAAAREGEGPTLDTTRCPLERAEAVHRYARTGEMTPPSELCVSRGDERMSLPAIDQGGRTPADSSLAQQLAFRDAPSLETLRDATRWLRPPLELTYLGEDELCAAGCVRSEEPDLGDEAPETPLERAAIAGDARALRALLPDGLALRLARTHEADVLVWATHRLRRLAGPQVRLERVRDDAYADLWIARRDEDEDAIERISERIDRLDAVTADRRRAVLLEALHLVFDTDP